MSERLLSSLVDPEKDSQGEPLESITNIEHHLGQSAINEAFYQIAFDEIITNIGENEAFAHSASAGKTWGGSDTLHNDADWG